MQEFTDVTAGVGYNFDQHTATQKKLSSAALLCLSNPYSAARFMLSHNTNVPTTHASTHAPRLSTYYYVRTVVIIKVMFLRMTLLLCSDSHHIQMRVCTIYLCTRYTLYHLPVQQVVNVVIMHHVFVGRKYRNNFGVLAA